MSWWAFPFMRMLRIVAGDDKNVEDDVIEWNNDPHHQILETNGNQSRECYRPPSRHR
jgi:hypothetical protein